MKCYRRLQPIKAMSFDLDDTLYSNRPIMEKTEQAMISYFSQLLADYTQQNVEHQNFSYRYWMAFRQQAIKRQPELKHDVTALRKETYFHGMMALGYTQQQAFEKAQQALDYFYHKRSDFSLPDEVHNFLNKLKQKLPLVAITNGNVDTDKIAISQYFDFIFHAGNGLVSKPDTDMFSRACTALNIAPQNLLHIGDCGRADVLGGIRSGCQTAWFAKYGIGKPLRVLPHIELSDIAELNRLV